MKNYKITLGKQELVTSRATFTIEGNNYKEIELFLKDTTYEEIEEVLEKKLNWKVEDEDFYNTLDDDIEEEDDL